ncbi:polyprenyl synthetase family protein [Terriglobus sp. 2YAB30_2]|uniref:polyprenyl synthetase family protein n=1 Tax=unclassified Terriglobus TaxID=2628988 RepID=UPI003F9C98E9
MSVETILTEAVTVTDAALERLLPGPDAQPHSIHRAMRHSTFAGGKRLRPALVLEAARMVAGSLPEGAEECGAAIEMLHTYSLIHDDLPALDNDDLRRGKPTCHVVFGEAIAILAGDALQTTAFQTLAQLKCPATSAVQILREVAIAVNTGVGTDGLAPGMIGGQVVDIESEGKKPTAELVEAIHRSKTGALITVSIVAGGLYAGASAEDVARLRTFGEKLGLAFQIVDDVLDLTQDSAQLGKTAGKDAATDKATWPAVYGIERSIADADAMIREAYDAIAPWGEAAEPLKTIARFLVERKH